MTWRSTESFRKLYFRSLGHCVAMLCWVRFFFFYKAVAGLNQKRKGGSQLYSVFFLLLLHASFWRVWC